MPATPARIGFVVSEWRSATASDSAVEALWGDAARDTSAVKSKTDLTGQTVDAEKPVETYFDNVADAQAVVNARLALLKQPRRRFEIQIGELLDFSGGLAFESQVPTFGFIDDEKAANMNGLLASIEALDFETGRTTVQVWG